VGAQHPAGPAEALDTERVIIAVDIQFKKFSETEISSLLKKLTKL
jgi:hypothetical protein